MHKKLCAIFLTLLSFSVWSQTSLLSNDREGESYFSKLMTKKNYERFKATTDLVAIESAWQTTLDNIDPQNVCTSLIYIDLKENYKKLTSNDFDGENTFLYLRSKNYIDDIGFNLFRKISQISPVIDLSKIEFKPVKENSLSKFLLKAKTRGFCPEAQFSNFVAEVNPDRKKVKKRKIKKILESNASEIQLTSDVRSFLKGLLEEDFYGGVLELGDYITKKKILREQYPIQVESEFSDFVTLEPKKADASLRMELYRKYSYVQIALMGKIITDLRAQLESDRIEILVYERNTDEVLQTISLDPMERFRFAISYLRKQMDDLISNSFFNGARPSYEEIVAAGFELGLITASEWDEVRGLEYIWSPQKSLFDKVMTWGRTLLPVASVLIPPPYGFVTTLAIVAIDAVTMKNKQDSQMTHSLFK